VFKEMDIDTYREWEKVKNASLKGFFEDINPGTFKDYNIKTETGNTHIMVYTPVSGISGSIPVYVNLHGGGFVLNFAEVDDIYCRWLTERAGCMVINVDYVVAPENKFPAAVEECYHLIKWLYENPGILGIDHKKIAMGGHSAGGNLTAAVCLLAKKRKEFKICLQILDYPVVDLAADPALKKNRNSNIDIKAYKDMIELCRNYNRWYLRSNEDGKNPLASPVFAGDLSGLPEALIITAEYDTLRDEAEVYAKRLEEAGVKVTYRMYEGCDHGFTHAGPKEAAIDAWELMASCLKNAF